MAEEKKGNVSNLKARLSGLKAEPGAPTGAPLVPNQTSTPAPFPVAQEANAEPAAPPVAAPPAGLPGLNLPPAVTPPVVGAPPGLNLPPMMAPPGLELPAPPPQPVVVSTPQPAYREPDPIYIDPDAGNFKLEDDEADRDFDAGKALGWVKFALPSAAIGLVAGLVMGMGSFGREFNEGRSAQVAQFKQPFEALSSSMTNITGRVMSIKDGEKAVDVKFAEEIAPMLENINMLSGDSLKQYNATFLKANTLSLLMQYRFLTDTFYKTILDHKKKVENTKDDLLKASQGALAQPRYVVVLLDQTDSGGIVSGSVCTMRADPKTSVREEEVVPEEEEPTPGAPPKPPAAPKKEKVTYKTYTLQAAFETKPFERESKVKSDGTESVREIVNQDLIPNYATQLLIDYQERVKNLKVLAKQIQELQTKVQAALDEDAARTVSF